MLLHEFDPNPVAVINPADIYGTLWGCPKVAVSCFERSAFNRMLERLGGVEITRMKKANWDAPVYRTSYKGLEIALFEAYVGAAGWTAGTGRNTASARAPTSPGRTKPRCWPWSWR